MILNMFVHYWNLEKIETCIFNYIEKVYTKKGFIEEVYTSFMKHQLLEMNGTWNCRKLTFVNHSCRNGTKNINLSMD